MKVILWTLFLLHLIPALVLAGEISGHILDLNQQPVSGATVVLCDQVTGIPVSTNTCTPFTVAKSFPPVLATALTDEQGRFKFHGISNGTYRLVSQSWKDTPKALDLFAVNGRGLTLHGVAGPILVPSPQALSVSIRPLGTASIILDEHFGNDGSLLVISPMPLTADPVLGFASWQGPFLQQAIGLNRMPGGYTRVDGLPEDRIHLSVFANDNNGGIGEGVVEAKAGRIMIAKSFPIVCRWSNGRHTPPAYLEGTFEEMKDIIEKLKKKRTLVPFLKRLLAKEGVKVRRTKKKESLLAPYYEHLQIPVTLPSGARAPFRDVLAAVQYLGLQKSLEPRKVAVSKPGAFTNVAPLPPRVTSMTKGK
jgi:hypothetical protein